MVRQYAAILAAVVLVSCGGGDSAQPSTPTTPTIPSTPAQQTWTIAGRVTDSVTGQPIGGVTVAVEGRTAVSTDPDGRWRLEGTGTAQARLPVTLQAAGYVARETAIAWQAAGRQDVEIDLIPDRAPFVLGFYRYLVRNGLEDPGSLRSVRRWTRNPNFYINTFNPRTSKPLEPQEVSLIVESLRQSVPQLTGSVLSAGIVETAETAREPRADYINVKMVHQPTENFCGRALVGANPGEIEINYDRCANTCGSLKVTPTAIAHEVGHALGFWHVDKGIMTAVVSSNCANVQFTEQERVHARIAYRRPVGNTDPDRDPSSFSAIVASGSAPMVACPLDR